jgi:hypothetical protein
VPALRAARLNDMHLKRPDVPITGEYKVIIVQSLAARAAFKQTQ